MASSSHSTQASDPSSTGVPGRPSASRRRRTCRPPTRRTSGRAPLGARRGCSRRRRRPRRSGASWSSSWPAPGPPVGGSSESEVKAWQVKPTGTPSSVAVTTVTPVAKWPSTSRNRAWSMSAAADGRGPPSSPMASFPLRAALSSAELDGRAPRWRPTCPPGGGRRGAARACPSSCSTWSVVVGRVVVEEEEALGPGLGGHPHGVGHGRVAPVGLSTNSSSVYWASCMTRSAPLAQLEDALGHAPAVERRLVVGEVGQRPPVGLDPEAERRRPGGAPADPHLGRAHGEVVVADLVEVTSPRKSVICTGKNGGCTAARSESCRRSTSWRGP